MKDEILYSFLNKLDIEDVNERFQKIGVSIYADKDKKEFKSTYEILNEISEKIFKDGD